MDATTKSCCLIGKPVEHSLSPMIHNTLAEWMGLNLAYSAHKVEPENVGDAIRGAYALDVLGLNVTVPHKCAVIPFLKEMDPLAAKIGAVNTLVRVEGGYKGYNTDIIGLARELKEEGIQLKDNDIIILGAGGASKAINYLCASEGAKRIYLLNRSILKAQEIAKEVNGHFGPVILPMTLADYKKIPDGKYPVIQTTSVGLYPNVDEAPIMEEDFYDRVSIGLDIIFNPARTRFRQLCEAHGARTVNGLKMLLYQGIAAFELWNETDVPQEYADKLLRMLAEKLDISHE